VVVEAQVHLDLLTLGRVQEGVIQDPAVGSDAVGVGGAHEVLLADAGDRDQLPDLPGGLLVAGSGRHPDLAFPQDLDLHLARPGWQPAFVDYLYLGLTNNLAFSPTYVMPLPTGPRPPWASSRWRRC